jgi:hypothetical protein
MDLSNNPINRIVDVLLDNKTSLTKKMSIVVIILTILLLIDYSTGFTHHIWTDYKLSQIEKIEQLKKQNPENKYLALELSIMEEKIINRSRNIVSDYFFSLFSSTSPRLDALVSVRDSLRSTTIVTLEGTRLPIIVDSSAIAQADTIIIPKVETISNNTPQFTNVSIDYSFWHVITSSYPYFLTFFILLITVIKEREFTIEALAGLILLGVMCFFLIWFFSALFSLIPIIHKPWVNYIINIFLQGVVILIFYLLERYVERRRKKKRENTDTIIQNAATDVETESEK